MPNPAETKEPHVPAAKQVPGGPKLQAWLDVHGRTQVWLSEQTDIKQQLLSAYINQAARPTALSEKAYAIQAATHGDVTVWDWLTAAEQVRYREAVRSETRGVRGVRAAGGGR